MPSKSYIDYIELLEDVYELRKIHLLYSKGKRGRKKLGFLTRSAIVMLCAAWERYNENLILECIDLILSSNIRASKLNKDILKKISLKVKNDKHDLKPIELADDGWKNVWRGYAINETELLNTPNSQKLNKLFKDYLGVSNYTKLWHEKSIKEIDNFIKIRGEIAHNGSKAKYVRFSTLNKSIEFITENVIQIDYSISNYLKEEFCITETWSETYIRSLEDLKKKQKKINHHSKNKN